MRYSVDMATNCWASIEPEDGNIIKLQANEHFEDRNDALQEPAEAPNKDGWVQSALLWMTQAEAVELATALLMAAREVDSSE